MKQQKTELCSKVFVVDRAYLIAEPGGFYVRAWGTARTNATNARLVICNKPHIPSVLCLDFCVTEGVQPVLTEVEACYPVDSLDDIDVIRVQGDTNAVEIRVSAKAA